MKGSVLYRAACEIVVTETGEAKLLLFELDPKQLENVLPISAVAPSAVVSIERILSLRDLVRSRGDILSGLLSSMYKALINYLDWTGKPPINPSNPWSWDERSVTGEKPYKGAK